MESGRWKKRKKSKEEERGGKVAYFSTNFAITSLPARSSKVAQVCWAGPSRASARRCSNSRRDRSLKDSSSASSVALATFARRSSSVGDGARFPRPIPFLPIINIDGARAESVTMVMVENTEGGAGAEAAKRAQLERM